MPSTNDLTPCAKRAFEDTYVKHWTRFGAAKDRDGEARAAAHLILEELRKPYGDDSWNFETLLHAVHHVEALASALQGTIGGAPATYRPAASIVAELKSELRDSVDSTVLRSAYFNMLRAIHDIVGRRMGLADSQQHAAREATARFLRDCAAHFRLTLIDLNYDSIADEAGVKWQDGFWPVSGSSEVSIFDPAMWLHRARKNTG
jgi:hypothetical protein